MQSAFRARRKPLRLGRDDDDIDGDDPGDPTIPSVAGSGAHFNVTDERRLSEAKDPLKIKKKAVARKSLGLGGTSMTDDDDADPSPTIFTPKRSNLTKQVLESNVLRKSSALSLPGQRLPHRNTEERPSYNADALQELKHSTPSTPQNLRSQDERALTTQFTEVDLATKFGSSLTSHRDLIIPTDVEIREKKERRKRLAKEQEFISLDTDGEEDEGDTRTDSEESNDGHSLLPYAQARPARKEETRLVRDDEDFAEGFDDFVEDGRIALGRTAEKAQKARQAAEMRTLIDDAEGSDSSSEDESEVERRAAYEAAQTRAGMDGLKKEKQGAKARRPRTPPRITPLPTLSGVKEKVEAELARKQYMKGLKEGRLREVKAELAEIEARKIEVQRLLNEAGDKLERLRADASTLQLDGRMDGIEKSGLGSPNGTDNMAQTTMMVGNRQQSDAGMMMAQRGLESLGDT